MKSRAILFDFGGTLDADGVHWSKQFYDTYQALGLAVSRERFDLAFVETDRIIASSYDVRGYSLRQLLGLQVSLQFENLRLEDPVRKNAIIEACYSSAKRTLERNRLLLEELHHDFTLGVISNFNGNLEVVCREFNLDTLLDLILDSGNLGIEKPDPRIFELALKRLKLNASSCYFVGDSFERDIVPAKQVGLQTVWLCGPDHPRCPEPTKVDYFISSLLELRNIFSAKGELHVGA